MRSGISDFHEGGTNAKGSELGLKVGLYDGILFNASYFITEAITGPKDDLDRLQLDLVFNFFYNIEQVEGGALVGLNVDLKLLHFGKKQGIMEQPTTDRSCSWLSCSFACSNIPGVSTQ